MFLFIFIFSIINANQTNSVQNFNPRTPLVFPEIIKKIMNDQEVQDLNQEQLDLLHRIYEALLCHKIKQYEKKLQSLPLFLMGVNSKKIQEAFETCKKHDLLQHAELFKHHEKTPNNLWISRLYQTSHNLKPDQIHTYQKVFMKSCKELISN